MHDNPHMPLRRLFLLTTTTLITLVVLMALRMAWFDLEVVRSSEAGLRAAHRAHLAMRLAEHASAERGPAILVLNDREPADPAKEARLDEFRSRSDDALANALQAVREAGAEAPAGALALLESVAGELEEARISVDHIASLPYSLRSARGTRITREPIDQMFGVVDTALAAVTMLSTQAERLHPDLAMALMGARLSAALREYAGRLGSFFTAPLAGGSPLGEIERREIPVTIGRIVQLKRLIDTQAEGRVLAADARIEAARSAMERSYFERGLPMVERLYERGLKGEPYGTDSATFVGAYVPEMKSIVGVRDTFLDVATEAARTEVSRRKNHMTLNAAMAALILCVELAVLALIRGRILAPLLESTQAMRRVLAGQPVPLKPVTRTDEIGDLQQALHAMQAMRMVQMQAEQNRANRIHQLEEASRVDHLTRLSNRRAFEEQSAQLLRDARRDDRNVAMFVIDLDHFKQINDRFGHEAGDFALVRAAQSLRSAFRDGDVLARYGGEEFIAITTGPSEQDALRLAERVREQLAALPLTLADGSVMDVTASIGIAFCSECEPYSVASLFDTADRALYEAKAAGRNRCVMHRVGSCAGQGASNIPA